MSPYFLSYSWFLTPCFSHQYKIARCKNMHPTPATCFFCLILSLLHQDSRSDYRLCTSDAFERLKWHNNSASSINLSYSRGRATWHQDPPRWGLVAAAAWRTYCGVLKKAECDNAFFDRFDMGGCGPPTRDEAVWCWRWRFSSHNSRGFLSISISVADPGFLLTSQTCFKILLLTSSQFQRVPLPRVDFARTKVIIQDQFLIMGIHDATHQLP